MTPRSPTRSSWSGPRQVVSVSERPLEPIFDDKSGLQKVSQGPVEFAIDGKKETAWGIDNGPGRRNQSRQAVFVCEDSHLPSRHGTLLTFRLHQTHGGWNSDDNQSHNLGRFRLSLTTSSGCRCRSRPGACPRHSGTPFPATHGPSAAKGLCNTGVLPCPSGRRPMSGSRELWQEHPEGSAQLVSCRNGKGNATLMS